MSQYLAYLDNRLVERERRYITHRMECSGCYAGCDPWWRDWIKTEKKRVSAELLVAT